MRTFSTHKWVSGTPEEVLELLTEPDAIARWAPIPFELLELDSDRLQAGTRARVSGGLAGRRMEFDIDIREADEQRLSLCATGPVSIGAEYRLRPDRDGAEVHASVSVSGRGLLGSVLARGAEALLAAGALNASVGRINRELELRTAA